MKRVRVAADRWNFELEGANEFVSPIGGNKTEMASSILWAFVAVFAL